MVPFTKDIRVMVSVMDMGNLFMQMEDFMTEIG